MSNPMPTSPLASKHRKNSKKTAKPEPETRKTQKNKITKSQAWKCYEEHFSSKDAMKKSLKLYQEDLLCSDLQRLEQMQQQQTNGQDQQTPGQDRNNNNNETDKNKPKDIFRVLPEADVCISCNHGVIQWSDENIPICSNRECGVMYHDTMMDQSPEWKFFKSDDKNNGNDPTRCGNPINPLLEESSIGCKISLPSHASSEMRRIKRWMDWQLMPYNEKALYDAFQYITTMAQLSGIAKTIIDRACWWYREFSLHEQHRGVKLASLKAASLDMASREFGCPRTPFEIAEIFKIDKKDAAKGCSIAEDIRNHMSRNASHTQNELKRQASSEKLDRALDDHQETNQNTHKISETHPITHDTPTPIYEELFSVTPSSFMERYCSKLKFNQELTILSRFIAQKIEKENLITDNMPHAISAGIIFFISVHCHLPITKTEIKNISGISEVTINKCFKKINLFHVHLLPKCILDKYNANMGT
jgi:transcription initiation factor TFIIIB Brf1 subunit/transcription initiation factor TFIIB